MAIDVRHLSDSELDAMIDKMELTRSECLSEPDKVFIADMYLKR